MNLYDETAGMARVESKIPVVTLSQHGRKGYLVVCAPEDLARIAAEYQKSVDR